MQTKAPNADKGSALTKPVRPSDTASDNPDSPDSGPVAPEHGRIVNFGHFGHYPVAPFEWAFLSARMGPQSCEHEPTTTRRVEVEFTRGTFEIEIEANVMVGDEHLVDEARYRIRQCFGDELGRFERGTVVGA